MRVLVTGSSGHVGGAIARCLAESAHTVIGLSRRKAEPFPAAIEQQQFDIGRDGFVEEAQASIKACDAVVHAAACLDSGLHAPEISRTNCWGTQQVLRLAHEWRAKQIVYISGIAVIGSPKHHPITEEHPVQPLTAYTASKLFGEHLVAMFAREHGCGASLRVSSPVGPGLTEERIFAHFVARALAGQMIVVRGKGGRRQDYIDVRDVARGVELCLRKCSTGVYNLGSGVPVSNRELAEEVVRTLKSASEIRFEGEPGPDEDLCWDLSLTRASQDLGYGPVYNLRDSIQALAEERAVRK